MKADAPELLTLLSDFQDTMREARTRVAPVLSAARQRQLPTDGGIAFLQVKMQLMLSYCTNLAFYLMLKAQGRAVRSHPVIDTLLRHRSTSHGRPTRPRGPYERRARLLVVADAYSAVLTKLMAHVPTGRSSP